MQLARPRFTIERLRTVVLVGGLVLIAAIGIFLAAGQWKLRRLVRDLPGRLGADIQVRSNGVDYTQTRKGKTIFKMHAARAVQMKKDGKTLLHDVKIDLYGEDGSRTDTISGSEFEYDPSAGIAAAAGAVEITLMRPGVKPAVVQMVPGSSKPLPPSLKQAVGPDDNQIHVKTSGLVFNQKTGLATTSQRVDFELRQGSGSSTGASYDSSKGLLILDQDVSLQVIRGAQSSNDGPVTVHALHAQFERIDQVCELIRAHAVYSNGTVDSGDAVIHFREDGSVRQVDGSGGVDLQSRNGSHATAPRGRLEFDEENHPRHGLLTGGAHLDVDQSSRQMQGTAPTIQLEFNNAGLLHSAHLEQGVAFQSQQETTSKGSPVRLLRTWKSQTADLSFLPAAVAPSGAGGSKTGARQAGDGKSSGKVEPSNIRGYGGVVLTSQVLEAGTQKPGGKNATPSVLSADTLVADLAPGGVLTSLSGTGHAVFDEVTAQGVHQSSNSDQLDVKFNPGTASHLGASGRTKDAGDAAQISTVTQIGHVVLTQDPAPASTTTANHGPGGQFAASSPVRATAARSDYDGQTQILHLSGSPRLRDGSLDMTSNLLDFNRATGDAFAHGDVKASWISQTGQSAGLPGASLLASGNGESGSKSSEPVHAIAAEAELRQATQEVVFRGTVNGAVKETSGNHASTEPAGNLPRMWQGSNSIAAPTITLNRQKQTLNAVTASAATPVRTVLLSHISPQSTGSHSKSPRSDAPSVIRLRSGDLHYSEGERLATLHGGSLGAVSAETNGPNGAAKVTSQEAEVHLLPEGVHFASSNAAQNDARASSASGSGGVSGSASIDRLVALGHVSVDWPNRKGTGEKLVYTGDDGNFILTGTSAVPPRITDQAQGTVTGSILIFHSGDDSVTVEGDGGKTVTETQAPKKRAPTH